jgi:nitroreductase
MLTLEKTAKTDAPIHELLAQRWSPRAFSSRPVEPEKLRSLFEAARWAPSSFNEQPWAFLVTTQQDPEAFAAMLSVLVEGNRAWAKDAPVLMLSVAKLNFERTAQPNRHAFHDVGLATANLMTQATALGLSVHAMAGFDVKKAREVFGIPEGWEAVAAIALGYPGDPESLAEKLRARELAPRSRKPLEQMVFSGKWGQTAPYVTPAANHSSKN